MAPKAAGVVRIGVVKVKDMSGESLPTDNLRLNLISEFGRHQLEAVPLDSEASLAEVEAEARSKQCDYFVYTVAAQVKAPGSGGLPAAVFAQRGGTRSGQVPGPDRCDPVQGGQACA